MKRLLSFIFIVIFLSLIFFLFFKVIKINKITCKSQSGGCNDRLKSEISSVNKGTIIQTRTDLNKTLQKDNSIEDYSINFGLPLSFNINIVQRKPIVAFITKEGNFAEVDNMGNITQTVPQSNLPKIVNYENLDQDEITYIANLMNELYTFYGSTSGRVNADGLEINGIRGKTVVFPLNGDRDVLLGALALILSRLPSVKEASTISVIDLRFKNPVLR